MKISQGGGFVLGMVVGLLVGLALALSVALYITKAPVPFINKVPGRTAEHDRAEAERNKQWNPNAPLGSKSGPLGALPEPEPAASSAGMGVLPPVGSGPAAVVPAPAAATRASMTRSECGSNVTTAATDTTANSKEARSRTLT